MRNKVIRSRLMLLSTGAIALATLAACGPDTSPTAAAPSAPQTMPAHSMPAEPVPSRVAATSATAPAEMLEVPPAMSAPADVDVASTGHDATPAAAEDTVRRYYASINAKDYAAAYALWSNGGAASRQTFDAFAGGYATTNAVQATVGKAFDSEGAAGSRYIQVPIELASNRSDGSTRHYRGNFTLRAVMADGATPEQRQWHLDSADLEGYEPPATAPAK